MFFRGAVDCALDKAESCIREMTEVINAAKGGDEKYEAHSILAGFYLRKSEYAQSLAETELILKIRPQDSDAQSNLAFLKAASTFPNQEVLSGAPTHVPWTYPTKSLTIPVTINGKHTNYFIDTGANVSTLSEPDFLMLAQQPRSTLLRLLFRR